MTLVSNPVIAELRRLHADRPYHNWAHVESMLRLFREYRDRLNYPALVEAAICFHDAVYDSMRQDNEKRSADLAISMLGRSVSGPMGDIVHQLIMATANHDIPAGVGADLANDIGYLLDFDLAVLGSSDDEYDAYVAAVREEYSWASDEEWTFGRRSVLTAFTARPSIFRTAAFTERFEASARSNLARELEGFSAIPPAASPKIA